MVGELLDVDALMESVDPVLTPVTVGDTGVLSKLFKCLDLNVFSSTGVGVGQSSLSYKLGVSGTGRFTSMMTAPTFSGASSGTCRRRQPPQSELGDREYSGSNCHHKWSGY